MRRRFEPASGLRGELTPPADKSISHRAALFAAMAEGSVTIRNFLDSADTDATLEAIARLGASVDRRGADVVIRGRGLYGAHEVEAPLDVKNAGTLLRLLPGWLAGQPRGRWILDGDESVRRRPVDRVASPLEQMGARVEARDGRWPPLAITASKLRGTQHQLEVASAQVKSCLLIAGLLASSETTVTEPAPSRDHTERLLRAAGAPITGDGKSICIEPADRLELDAIAIPGDPSSAAFFATAAWLCPGSRIHLRGIGLNWTRTGFYRIAERMGAGVYAELEPWGVTAAAEPIGDIEAFSTPLRGVSVGGEEVPLAIDELLLVALLGVFAEGVTVVSGAEELRVKESDRIAVVTRELRCLGADIDPTWDGFVVHGTGTLEGGAFDACSDHRMAMLGAVAGLASRRGVEVEGIESAGVSYPSFVGDLAQLTGRS